MSDTGCTALEVVMKIAVAAGFLVFAACTVNVYDYSSHSGSGEEQEPDTVFIGGAGPEIGLIPIPPVLPDTVVSIYPLPDGGQVRIERFGNWSRYTLLGCVAETEGISFEMRPVTESTVSPDGAVLKEYQLQFTCRVQSYLLDSGEISSMTGNAPASSASVIVMPVVTGTELVTIVAGRTSFPFLEEESVSYVSKRLADGTLVYDAVFTMSNWKLRDISTAGQLVASSEDPEFRAVFTDASRKLLQQYYELFVILDGTPPVIPAGSDRPATRN
jgi:hypothetical protein